MGFGRLGILDFRLGTSFGDKNTCTLYSQICHSGHFANILQAYPGGNDFDTVYLQGEMFVVGLLAPVAHADEALTYRPNNGAVPLSNRYVR